MEPIILPITHPTGAYDVIVGADLHKNVRELANIQGSVVLITDSNVGPLYADAFGEVDCLIMMPAGEENKTLATVNRMYSQMVAAGIDRKSTVVALGGGVVGDVAGFRCCFLYAWYRFCAMPHESPGDGRRQRWGQDRR